MKVIALLLLTTALARAASLQFEWAPADPGTTGYNFYGILGSATNNLGSTVGVNSTNITVNAAPNGSWRFQVTALYPEGESAPSNVVPVFVQAAPAPTVFPPLITPVGGAYTASFTWTAPPHDYYVTNYVVRLTRAGSTLTATTASLSVSFTGLQSGHYEFSVAGVNMTGEGLPGTRSFNILGPPKNLKVSP